MPDLGGGDFLGGGLLATCLGLGLDWFCFLRRAISLRSFAFSILSELEDGGGDFLVVAVGVFLVFATFFEHLIDFFLATSSTTYYSPRCLSFSDHLHQ